jgi:hypothetical protein
LFFGGQLSVFISFLNFSQQLAHFLSPFLCQFPSPAEADPAVLFASPSAGWKQRYVATPMSPRVAP